MGSKILNFDIYNKSKIELLDDIDNFKKVHIISGNPQILMNGSNDKKLLKNFTSSNSVIIPDGVGTVISSKLVGQPVKEKIAGIEVMDEIIKKCARENKSVYLLGSKKEVLVKCINNLKMRYDNLNIVGEHDGYFDIDKCESIISDIKNKKPYALFVAMGSPKQENFISDNMEKLPCKIFMGVGGSFDIYAGTLKRAPKWMINIGLEWLYRVYKEPFRIKRLGAIPKFILKAVKNNKSKE